MQVAENVLRAVEASERGDAPMRFLISCNPAELRAQAAKSTERCAAKASTLIRNCGRGQKIDPASHIALPYLYVTDLGSSTA